MLASRLSENAVLDWLHAVAPASAQLVSDSRQLQTGDIFFMYSPVITQTMDYAAYIAQAIEKGASAIVHEPVPENEANSLPAGFNWPLPHLMVPALRENAGKLARAYYQQPDEGIFTIAVTGTNGKTSCTQWLGSALSKLAAPTLVMGTLGNGLFRQGTAEKFISTGFTTPDAVSLHRHLASAHQAGARALAIEASSIGLDQYRLTGLHIDVALLTNFTRDHLDYHSDMTAYELAKTRLFDWPGLQHAVINLDDDFGQRIMSRLMQRSENSSTKINLTGYSMLGKSWGTVPVLQAHTLYNSAYGIQFHLDSPFGKAVIKTRLAGQFNVSNVLGVIGVLLTKGISFDTAVEAATAFVPPPGRMQSLTAHNAPLVIIDYAHTPDALEKTLAALRPVATENKGKLWCVFGCGGDRDPGKRPQMGAVSMAADQIVLTSDNPRYENPLEIIQQIAAGIKNKNFQIIEDRAHAIFYALKQAHSEDVILLAGKGHEMYQEIKGQKYPFSDAEHIISLLSNIHSKKRVKSI